MGEHVIKCYSIGCPRCIVLEKKLQQKNIDFELIADREIMESKGFQSAPMLEVDGVVYDFNEAVKWIGEQ
jgi:glutaredoxin-related protein